MCLTTEIQSAHQPLHLVSETSSENVYETSRLARSGDNSSSTARRRMEDDYSFHTISIPKRRSSEKKCRITNIEMNKQSSGNDEVEGKAGSDVETSSITSVMDFEDDFATRSVTWAQPSVVTEIHYRPKMTVVEKQELFYNDKDMQRFRLDAKMAMKMGRTQRIQSLQPSPSGEQFGYTEKTSPISGLVDMATNYLERLLTSQEDSISERHTSSTVTENTNTLIETLYLY